MRLLEVDLTGRGVERGAAGGREIGTKELVHAGSRPAFIRSGNQAMNNRLDQAPDRRPDGGVAKQVIARRARVQNDRPYSLPIFVKVDRRDIRV